ncbi:glyoxalase superfamily protein [Actinoplanes couchii]|uniref:glyoxalase superfamily protein n=1 Tax=Actinoplanes couchii TaxID=403638 RepID=UPI0035A23E27
MRRWRGRCWLRSGCGRLGEQCGRHGHHRFEPGFPVFLCISRGPMQIFLSEHHGDARPGTLPLDGPGREPFTRR